MDGYGIIVQARVTSTRLPSKVLEDLDGVPLLEFLINRLRLVNQDIKIIVATTRDQEDDIITKLCDRVGIPYYRGSRENVLKRYVQCAQEFNINKIIRVCSDCPFISIRGIEELILSFKDRQGIDLIHNKHQKGYPFGTGAEIVTLQALEYAYIQAIKK